MLKFFFVEFIKEIKYKQIAFRGHAVHVLFTSEILKVEHLMLYFLAF